MADTLSFKTMMRKYLGLCGLIILLTGCMADAEQPTLDESQSATRLQPKSALQSTVEFEPPKREDSTTQSQAQARSKAQAERVEAKRARAEKAQIEKAQARKAQAEQTQTRTAKTESKPKSRDVNRSRDADKPSKDNYTLSAKSRSDTSNQEFSKPEQKTIVFNENFEGYKAGKSWLKIKQSKVIQNCPLTQSKCLSVAYKPTRYGSFRTYAREKIIPDDHYILSYDIFFKDNFEFVKGGKLPGLGPMFTAEGCSNVTKRSWGVRPMWRGRGKAQAYFYGQRRKWGCGKGEVSELSAFEPNIWQKVELEVKLNSKPNSKDGFIILRVDGKEISKNENLRIRGRTDGITDIHYFYFSSFFGGKDRSWAPSRTQHIMFDNFLISEV